MPTPAITVVRYSALVGGIFYGILHRRTLQAKLESSTAAAEFKKREHWIEDAKKAWAQKQLQGSDGLITDPDAPGFDLEKFLKSCE